MASSAAARATPSPAPSVADAGGTHARTLADDGASPLSPLLAPCALFLKASLSLSAAASMAAAAAAAAAGPAVDGVDGSADRNFEGPVWAASRGLWEPQTLKDKKTEMAAPRGHNCDRGSLTRT